MAGDGGSLEGGWERAAGGAGGEPADEEACVEGVAGAGRVCGDAVLGGDFEAEVLIVFAGEDRGALRAALHDDGRGEVQQAIDRVGAEEGLRLGRGREDAGRGRSPR